MDGECADVGIEALRQQLPGRRTIRKASMGEMTAPECGREMHPSIDARLLLSAL